MTDYRKMWKQFAEAPENNKEEILDTIRDAECDDMIAYCDKMMDQEASLLESKRRLLGAGTKKALPS